MPVRIHDIPKKLGIENKEVLAKAKELGITAARVPSSSLDKITAEYLESHLKPAAPALPETPPPLPSVPEPIVIVSAPAPESPPIQVEAAASAPPLEAATPVAPPSPASPLHDAVEPPTPAAPPEPPSPPPPPPPRIGELVGRIQLPLKPVARPADKGGLPKAPPRGVTPTPSVRPELGRGRMDPRTLRGP